MPFARIKVVLSVIAWLVLWQGAAMLIHNAWIFAGPLDTLYSWVELVQTVKFWLSIIHSLGSIALGFVCAFICGIILGYFAGKHLTLRTFLKPAITVIKSAPVVCIIALLLIIAGSNATTSIVVGLVVFPQFYHAISEAVLARNEDLDVVLDIFDTPPLRHALCVEFVAYDASIRAAMAVAVGLAWKSGVAAELIGLPGLSIGEGVYLAKISLESASIIAWTATVILMSWASEKALLALCKAAFNVPKRWLASRVSSALAVQTQGSAVNVQQQPCAIALHDVKRTFDNDGNTEIISYSDNYIDASSRVCVMAPSGSGKTTLLRMLAGIDAPSTGSILYTAGKAAPIQKPDISLMLQDGTSIAWASSLENIALIAQDVHEIRTGADYLHQVLDDEALVKPTSDLSGGMRRRAELCRALAHPSSVVILDEPFAGLDADSKQRCADLINSSLAGRTLIVATHDKQDAELLAAKIIHIP